MRFSAPTVSRCASANGRQPTDKYLLALERSAPWHECAVVEQSSVARAGATRSSQHELVNITREIRARRSPARRSPETNASFIFGQVRMLKEAQSPSINLNVHYHYMPPKRFSASRIHLNRSRRSKHADNQQTAISRRTNRVNVISGVRVLHLTGMKNATILAVTASGSTSIR